MANIPYNGGNVTVPFTTADTIVYGTNVPVSAIVDYKENGSSVTIITTAGSLTLTGITLAQLTSSNFSLQGGGVALFGDNLSTTVNDAGGNTLTGTANADIIAGLGGADTIVGGEGNNLLFGGTGVSDAADAGDSITGGTGNDRIYGNGGNDTIDGVSGNDSIFGGFGVDSINSVVFGGQNAQVFGGGSMIDTTDLGDTLNVQNFGTLAAFGNAGADTFNVNNGAGGNATLFGGLDNDTFNVTAGGGSSTAIYGGTGSVGSNADIINVTGANATANVTVFGGNNATDTVDGADIINVNAGNSLIYGNAGDDTINVTVNGAARTDVFGGIGTDGITVNFASSAGRAQIFGGTQAAGAAENITITGAGNTTIFGGNSLTDTVDGADNITASTGNDLIYGNAGNDVIVGGGGNDTIFGGLGNDDITVGTGTVSVNGAAGTDTFRFGTTLDASDIVDGGADADILNAGSVTAGGLNGVSNVETINLNGNNTIVSTDSLVGAGQTVTVNQAAGGTLSFNGSAETNGKFVINGAELADTITGGAGNDNITGNAGTDSLVGGAGVDTINGGDDADTIAGGTGADILTLGAGNDRVNYSNGDTTTPTDLRPEAGDTYVGSEVITDIAGGDVINTGNANLTADAGTMGTLENNEFIKTSGAYDAVTQTFTVGAGTDAILLYDQDPSAALNAGSIVLIGGAAVTPTNAGGELTFA